MTLGSSPRICYQKTQEGASCRQEHCRGNDMRSSSHQRALWRVNKTMYVEMLCEWLDRPWNRCPWSWLPGAFLPLQIHMVLAWLLVIAFSQDQINENPSWVWPGEAPIFLAMVNCPRNNHRTHTSWASGNSFLGRTLGLFFPDLLIRMKSAMRYEQRRKNPEMKGAPLTSMPETCSTSVLQTQECIIFAM